MWRSFTHQLDDNLYVINKPLVLLRLLVRSVSIINFAQDAEFDNNNGILYLAVIPLLVAFYC
jgi:hypothetical protein